MEKKSKSISRGKALHQAAKVSSLSIREIVKKAGFSYPAFYVHIKNDELDFNILAKYAKAMQHSFSDEFPEISEYLMEDKVLYGKQLTYDDLLIDRDKWKEKYFEAIERYNHLVDKYNKMLESKLNTEE